MTTTETTTTQIDQLRHVTAAVTALAEHATPDQLLQDFALRRLERTHWSQVVGEGGLEPPRSFEHRNLNPARLPIPPLARRAAEGTGCAAAY